MLKFSANLKDSNMFFNQFKWFKYLYALSVLGLINGVTFLIICIGIAIK